MVLAAHHPNYLPSIEFFSKVANADIFVLADDLQYTTHSLINRGKIKTAGGWHWLTVPVLTKGKGRQKIREVKIDTRQNWEQKHWKSQRVNYVKAPYFEQHLDFFEYLYRNHWTYLVDLNATIIRFLTEAFGLRTQIALSSEWTWSKGGEERLPEMLQHFGCDTYLCRQPGPQDQVDAARLQNSGYHLRILDREHPPYHQLFGEFVPNLSAIDLLFNEGERSREILWRAKSLA